MVRAGEAAFRALARHFPTARRLAVVCGVGNNGGDGYVVARLAREAGWIVQVWQLGDPARFSSDAQQVRQQYLMSGGHSASWQTGCLESVDVVVDALLGIGISGTVRGEVADAIANINASERPVVALDVPSGLNADTGQPLGEAVRANLTVTFIGLKPGLFTGAGPDYCGTVELADLDVPKAVFDAVPTTGYVLSLSSLLHQFPPRAPSTHKGQCGHCLVIGGSPGYGGAARLAAEAAARVGAGLVTVATHPDHGPFLGVTRPELMVHGVRNGKELAPLLARATVLVVGPGLGLTPWGRSLWKAALATNLSGVMDADGLNLLAQQPTRLESWILTPHPGEAARLLGQTTTQVQADRLETLAALVERYGGVGVLKGAGTLVGGPREQPGLCPLANPALASGGMGDVLAGAIGGLLAQGLTPALAARLGVCLHAWAGVLASSAGQRGTLAGDLIPYLRQGLANPSELQP